MPHETNSSKNNQKLTQWSGDNPAPEWSSSWRSKCHQTSWKNFTTAVFQPDCSYSLNFKSWFFLLFHTRNKPTFQVVFNERKYIKLKSFNTEANGSKTYNCLPTSEQICSRHHLVPLARSPVHKFKIRCTLTLYKWAAARIYQLFSISLLTTIWSTEIALILVNQSNTSEVSVKISWITEYNRDRDFTS